MEWNNFFFWCQDLSVVPQYIVQLDKCVINIRAVRSTPGGKPQRSTPPQPPGRTVSDSKNYRGHNVVVDERRDFVGVINVLWRQLSRRCKLPILLLEQYL